MNKRNIKINKAQSILEYLAVLTMVVGGITVGTVFFKRGVEQGLSDAQGHLQRVLPQAVDNTYQAEIITYDVTYTGESTNGGLE